MSNQLQTREVGTLRQWVNAPEVVERADRALGGWMKGEDFLAQIVISMGRDDLVPCTEQSKFAAANLCAALGLLPSMQHVALIPRKQNGGLEVTVMPQWQGFAALILRHPDVLDVQVHLVHTTDRLEYNSVTKQIVDHVFDPFDPARKFDKIEEVRGGYLDLTWRDRSRPNRFHFVTQETIRKARACAQTQNVWNAWFKEQCLKTIYRNAYGRRVVPIDPLVNQRMERLTNVEDTSLGNDPSRITAAAVVPSQPALSRAAHLASQLGATQPPPVVSASPAPVVEQAEKKPAKKAAAKTESIHPPTVPEHLLGFAKAIHACNSKDDVSNTYEEYIATDQSLMPEDVEAAKGFAIWKLTQLHAAKKGDGKLFETNPNTGK